MVGPPNTVAIASPIPTEYFGSSAGGHIAQTQPSAFQFTGHTQPIIPQIHVSAVTNPLDNFRPGVHPIPTTPATPPIGRRIRELLDKGDYTNPLSYWRRQLEALNLYRRR